MAIENSQLTNLTALLTVPAGKTYAITSIMVCNTYSTNSVDPQNHTASFDMHFLKNNQSRDNQITAVIRELEIPAGETFTFDSEKIILSEGDSVVFVAQGLHPDGQYAGNATDLAANLSYLEV